MESESTEMYLKSIYELGHDDDPVPISLIAERLGVTAVSVNEMIKRLVERDLVVHLPYKGVALTQFGQRRALNVLRRHRLWECFLVRNLGIAWEKSHDLACQLEHATAEEVTEGLAGFLQHPEICPHGNPIPTPDGTTKEAGAVPLIELEVGQGGVISNIFREETPLLEYLVERGIIPGAPVTVIDVAPYNGPYTLLLGEREVVLGREIGARVMIMLEQAE
nr:metal-dependent transcriptional regulator [Anaerolineae bacterium]